MKPEYIYAVDDRLPLGYALIYGLQWTVIMFPGLIIVAKLSGIALHADLEGEVRFFQLLLLTSGLFTSIQSLWGHRYPLLDGPSTALLLTLIVLAPYGMASIQGGLIAGSVILILLVLLGKLEKVIAFATPNVVGVILMLIAFSLLPHLTRIMTGVDGRHPHGDMAAFSVCLVLVVIMASFSHWFKGFWKTIALLLGMVVGTVFFSLSGLPDYHDLQAARWVSLPSEVVPSWPQISWPVVLAFACTYLAVAVNSLGSLHGVAHLTDQERLPTSINRGIFINGAAGICCGFMGVVGMVSYSMSPGVILATRVSSRYATAWCGAILIIAAFVPKLAALLVSDPGSGRRCGPVRRHGGPGRRWFGDCGNRGNDRARLFCGRFAGVAWDLCRVPAGEYADFAAGWRSGDFWQRFGYRHSFGIAPGTCHPSEGPGLVGGWKTTQLSKIKNR